MGIIKNIRSIFPLPKAWENDSDRKAFGIRIEQTIRDLFARILKNDASAVHKTGDESISGTKSFTKEFGLNISPPTRYRYIRFFHGENGANLGGIRQDAGSSTNVTANQLVVYLYSPKATPDTETTGKYEMYKLPSVDSGLTANKQYDILTTKDSLKNNATTTDSGYALDARMGKTLMDAITGLFSYNSVSAGGTRTFNDVPNGSLLFFALTENHAMIAIKTSTNGFRQLFKIGTLTTISVSSNNVTFTNSASSTTGYALIINRAT